MRARRGEPAKPPWPLVVSGVTGGGGDGMIIAGMGETCPDISASKVPPISLLEKEIGAERSFVFDSSRRVEHALTDLVRAQDRWHIEALCFRRTPSAAAHFPRLQILSKVG